MNAAVRWGGFRLQEKVGGSPTDEGGVFDPLLPTLPLFVKLSLVVLFFGHSHRDLAEPLLFTQAALES
jgi:hypothetical protein